MHKAHDPCGSHVPQDNPYSTEMYRNTRMEYRISVVLLGEATRVTEGASQRLTPSWQAAMARLGPGSGAPIDCVRRRLRCCQEEESEKEV